VTTGDGDSVTARHLVSATGVLSMPYFPEIAGRENFDGVQLHTGLWPATPVDFTGKRVAIVGTGSSGVQLVPIVAELATSLTVYQRTANWCTPLNNSPITAEDQAQLRAEFDSIRETLHSSPSGFLHQLHDRATFDDAADVRAAFFERMWRTPGFGKLISHYTDLTFNVEANAEWCRFVAAKIRSIVADATTARLLIPNDHRYGEKRPPFVTDYYQAFNNPTVSLVDLKTTPMLRLTDAGIETADGLREADIIVWATGFDFGTGALARMGIRGRDGVALTDHWADGPSTYLGIQTAGFPNLFFPGGPHAAAGNNPRYNGDQVDFVTDLLCFARDHGFVEVEPETEAEQAWTSMIDRAARKAPSFGECSYYFGSNIPGKPRKYLLNSAGRPKLLSMIAEIKADDFAPFRFA
jgi:cation diffusion facilitator CzcD-associated flavoprotein CzcO